MICDVVESFNVNGSTRISERVVNVCLCNPVSLVGTSTEQTMFSNLVVYPGNLALKGLI